jgi:hypothetical protein
MCFMWIRRFVYITLDVGVLVTWKSVYIYISNVVNHGKVKLS